MFTTVPTGTRGDEHRERPVSTCERVSENTRSSQLLYLPVLGEKMYWISRFVLACTSMCGERTSGCTGLEDSFYQCVWGG